MDVNWTDCDGYFTTCTNIATYTNIESLGHSIETNVILSINYNSKKSIETTNEDNIEVKEPMDLCSHRGFPNSFLCNLFPLPLKWEKYVRLRAIRQK